MSTEWGRSGCHAFIFLHPLFRGSVSEKKKTWPRPIEKRLLLRWDLSSISICKSFRTFIINHSVGNSPSKAVLFLSLSIYYYLLFRYQQSGLRLGAFHYWSFNYEVLYLWSHKASLTCLESSGAFYSPAAVVGAASSSSFALSDSEWLSFSNDDRRKSLCVRGERQSFTQKSPPKKDLCVAVRELHPHLFSS